MHRRYGWLIGLLGAALVIGIANQLFRSNATPSTTGMTVGAALGGNSADVTGYERAYAPRPFSFPTDHGAHPTFRNEWWYVTGNLVDTTGRQFGYQLTLFRIALAPILPLTDSAWRTNQLYMGHFALTDVKEKRHHAFERFSREAIGLAGAQLKPLHIWLDDWALSGTEADLFPLRIYARQDATAVDLTLNPTKPIVLQGDQGLSQKSAEPGNASYYYSYTRLSTQGTVQVGENTFQVTGTSWLDREWSTSALGPEQSGWDWFALQLDDGRDLMLYRMRRKNGSADPFSRGMLITADGQARALSWSEIDLQPLGEWASPTTGDRYPAGWRLRLPGENLELTITPKVANQEMQLTVHYWEGAVAVDGRFGDRKLGGHGYLEMTRYEKPVSR